MYVCRHYMYMYIYIYIYISIYAQTFHRITVYWCVLWCIVSLSYEAAQFVAQSDSTVPLCWVRWQVINEGPKMFPATIGHPWSQSQGCPARAEGFLRSKRVRIENFEIVWHAEAFLFEGCSEAVKIALSKALVCIIEWFRHLGLRTTLEHFLQMFAKQTNAYSVLRTYPLTLPWLLWEWSRALFRRWGCA